MTGNVQRMGLDDDADCPLHVWELAEVDFSGRGAQMVQTCAVCGAVSYDRSAADDPHRLP